MPVRNKPQTKKKATSANAKNKAVKAVLKKAVLKKAKSRKGMALDILSGGDWDNPDTKTALVPKVGLTIEAVEKQIMSEIDLLIEKDPTATNKYLLWMAEQRAKGHNFEDISATVTSFHRRNKSLKHQDINKYKNLKELEDEILSLNPSKSEKKYLSNLKLGVDYFPLIENDVFRLYHVKSYKGSKNLGKNTSWCISSNSSYWSNYSNGNDVFIVIDSNNEANKFALLRGYKGYNNGTYDLYNKNDRRINLDSSFSPALVREIKNKINLILSISGREGLFSKDENSSYLLALPKDVSNEMKEFDLKELSRNVIENNLICLMPFSSNKELILSLKDDIKKYMGKITFSEKYSTEFFEVFIHEMDISKLLSIIKTKPFGVTKIKKFSFILDDLPKEKYVELISDAKYKSTKTSLIKYRLNECIDIIDRKHITESMASKFLEKYGEDGLLKIYHLFGKPRKYRWSRYYYDTPLTSKIKKMQLSETVINKLLEKEDLPVKFRAFLTRKNKVNPLTKRELKKVNALINIFLKDKKPIDGQAVLQDFYKYLNKK